MHRRMSHVFFAMMCVAVYAPLHAGLPDEMKPCYYAKEQELRQLFDRLAEKGIEYEIKIEHKRIKHSFFGHHVMDTYSHKVSIPRDIQGTVRAFDWRFVSGNFLKYVQDRRFSFYAAILLLAREPEEHWFGLRLEPLEKHDKTVWDEDLPKYTSQLIEAFHLNDIDKYRNKILFDSIPAKYHDKIFADRIYVRGKSILQKPYGLDVKPFGEAIREVNDGRGAAKLQDIPLTQTNLEMWLCLTLYEDEANRLGNLKGFLAWCRLHGQDKPFLSAVMMGLFTVDGYVFNDEKGTYELNERGRLLLDYVIEFPIPENATRLKIVRDGGNQALVDDLMKKHDTSQAWQELLKNPVAPKFVEFKQHPREK